jgi:menaquinone-dependent protoporphyrinogen IX oxidase
MVPRDVLRRPHGSHGCPHRPRKGCGVAKRDIGRGTLDASDRAMERKRITCPETGRLEDVELDRTPLGLIVTGCSSHRDDAFACPCECARRMDRRDRADVEGERVIVILASLRDRVARVASTLVRDLADDGLTVELAELGTRSMPPLEDYDAVVIGAQVRFGRHARAVIDYIREHREALAAMPAFFYSVGGRNVFNRDGYIERMTRRTGWHPKLTATFADASAAQQLDIRSFAHQIADEIPAAPPPSLI